MEIGYQVCGMSEFRCRDLFGFISSYFNQITLYRSLHAHQQSILESTIQEISYLGSPSIMTEAGTGCILLEKVLDVVGSSMDI